jgi:hypothetical protein
MGIPAKIPEMFSHFKLRGGVTAATNKAGKMLPSTFKPAMQEIGRGFKQFGTTTFNGKVGFNKAFHDTFTRNVVQGAAVGAVGSVMHSAAGGVFPGYAESNGIGSSAFSGAMKGALLGSAGVLGGSLTKARLGGNYSLLNSVGTGLTKASSHWAARTYMLGSSFMGGGNFSLTKPLNKNRNRY